jgi:putative ABC transport system permease protein
MFSVVYGVLLRPLPWRDPDRVVAVHMVYPERRSDPRYATTWNRSPLHYPAWDALRRASTFEDVAVWQRPTLSMTIDRGRSVLADAMHVSSNFLPLLGVNVIYGRNFRPEADGDEAYEVILSYEAWQQWFGGRTEVVGAPSDIAYASDTHTPPWTIVGVLEPGFSFQEYKPAILLPVGMNARTQRLFFRGDLESVGRLKRGTSIESASAEAGALIQASQPGVPLGARVVPLADEQLGHAARPLWLMFGAAGVLLLVASANVAGLLLGENRARGHETAIRLALGITRGGIVRQLVVEHVMLATAGAAAGLVLASWITRTLMVLAPADLPRADSVGFDWRVALFALAAGSLTLIGFGLAPAVGVARTRAAEMLADGAREAPPGRHRAQRTIVAAEIGMALVLVVGASLLGETLFRLLSQPLGFDPANLIVVNTRFTGSDIPADWRIGTRGKHANNSGPPLAERVLVIREARTNAAVARLSALPGVARAAAIGTPPLTDQPGPTAGAQIRFDGRPLDGNDRAAVRVASAGFAQTLRVPMLSMAFACTALLLAAIGLYGVAARRVADRRRGCGIRVALGAAPANLRALVLRDGSLTVGMGLAAGLPAAFAAAQVTRSFLFGVTPASPHVLVGASAFLSAAALLATYVPARRAARADPGRVAPVTAQP